MSNDPVTSMNEQLKKTASPASSTQSESRRDEPTANPQTTSRSGEESNLSSLESAASAPVSEGKRFIDAPADAKQSPESSALAAPFSHAAPADKVDDLADVPKGASVQYREKYAAVMREFRDGKLQVIVKDRTVAVAIAAERAAKADAGQQQKQASSTDQKQSSSPQQKQASSTDQKQSSSPQQKQASRTDQKQSSSPQQKPASGIEQKDIR